MALYTRKMERQLYDLMGHVGPYDPLLQDMISRTQIMLESEPAILPTRRHMQAYIDTLERAVRSALQVRGL